MTRLRAVIAAFGVLCVSGATAVVVAPTDTFDGTNTGGWQAGAPHPAPPVTDTDCGDMGAGDGCLRIRSLNVPGGPGSRLGAYNSSPRWTGDYIAAGIESIRLFAQNSGFQDLNLRIRLQGTGGNFISAGALVLPASSAGQTYEFSLAPEALSPLDPAGVTATLRNVTRIWIFHNALPEFPPPVGPYEVLLDDVTAVEGTFEPPTGPIGIPATSALALILLGLLVVFLARTTLRGRERR